jgi:DNA polymerase-3 subunit beta
MRRRIAQAARRSRRHGQLSLSESKIRFGLGTAILTSKLIDGTFPDYSRVIPTANDKLLRIDPRSFEEGVDRVATIASEKTRAVKMAIERDKITLSVTSPENGTAAEEVPGDYGAEALEIGFNARYLLDILGQIEGDTVEVHLADAAAPTLLRENDKAPALTSSCRCGCDPPLLPVRNFLTF